MSIVGQVWEAYERLPNDVRIQVEHVINGVQEEWSDVTLQRILIDLAGKKPSPAGAADQAMLVIRTALQGLIGDFDKQKALLPEPDEEDHAEGIKNWLAENKPATLDNLHEGVKLVLQFTELLWETFDQALEAASAQHAEHNQHAEDEDRPDEEAHEDADEEGGDHPTRPHPRARPRRHR